MRPIMKTHSLVLQTFLAAELSSAHFMHDALKACAKVVSINLCSLHRSNIAQSMTVRDVLDSYTQDAPLVFLRNSAISDCLPPSTPIQI